MRAYKQYKIVKVRKRRKYENFDHFIFPKKVTQVYYLSYLRGVVDDKHTL